MKKIKFLILLAFALLLAHPAFAMNCKKGNYGSDECWTDVMISPIEKSPVSIGTVLVYDFNSGDPDLASFQTIVATTSTDGYRVAGVAQRVIATGDRGSVMVKGHGKLRVATPVVSGDRLFVSAKVFYGSAGVATTGLDSTAAATHDKAIAFATANSATLTSGIATADAYITVV